MQPSGNPADLSC